MPTDSTRPTYRGRFAPSPTGPLHFGSLVAALAGFLEARRAGGLWFVRIDDLDPPREAPGAADAILRTLEALGLTWDGEAGYQSRHADRYADALERLRARGLVYACGCTRREIADSALAGIDGPVYPGTCRAGLAPDREARTLRLRTDGTQIEFHDRWQGIVACDLGTQVGDFVLKRADGLYAYQLAVVVDDADLGITDVVRGADLLDSTPRQIHIQRLLGLPTPSYAHLPAAVNHHGEKLSKQTYARPLDTRAPGAPLHRALAYLGQQPPDALAEAPTADVLEWARAHWQPERVARTRTRPAHD
ncbi:MAG TPA: tRNA glutamyl-Q(34) synthetase GluQRS [Acidiferrobacterales bacterium]